MKLGDFLENHLWQIICGGMALYAGWITGQNETRNQIDQLRRELTAMQKDIERQERFARCGSYHLTRLETGHTGEVPKCLE